MKRLPTAPPERRICECGHNATNHEYDDHRDPKRYGVCIHCECLRFRRVR